MAIERLLPENLKNICDPQSLHFETTEEVLVESQMIDQERGANAILFGLHMKAEGYNIYISGMPGTGRNTSVLKAVHEIAAKEPVPNDICYLYNFKTPDEPKVLILPPGKGFQFKKDMELLIKELVSEIQKAFESKEYDEIARKNMQDFEQRKEKVSSELERYARAKGFILKQTVTGIAILPLKGANALLSEEEYEELSDSQKEEISKQQSIVQAKLDDAIQEIKEMDKEAKERLRELDEKVALYAVGDMMKEVKSLYDDFYEIKLHLDDIQEDIIQNIDSFKREKKPAEIPFLETEPRRENILKKYEINLLVDHSETNGAPVVVESNPTYYNLIGRIEYAAQMGVMVTDFTMIKPGAMHKANGGYLIIQALDILQDPYAWDALKKILKHQRIKIEDINERFRLVTTQGLKPQPIPVEIKVILVGSFYVYQLLYFYDEDFRKIFKVKADFDMEMKRSEERIQQYAYFVAAQTKKKGLLPFHNTAVARVVEYGSRLTEHQHKLSARFSKIEDIVEEAAYWAKQDNAEQVKEVHVVKAVDQKIYRANMIEDKMDELFEDGTLLVNVQGKEVGQLNGLSVLELGNYSFGKPSRITARTFLGKGDVINIEREVKLSGRIHSKGVLILHGYLGALYAQDKPLSLSATICFEQMYEEVDGDSASSSELYCLLSSLSGVALDQGIAVTGSVDQRGYIQPVGGINEKIEGFYSVCKIKGLTGKQGVMIPKSNTKHLMLNDEVIQAVRSKQFSLFAVEHIDEGIEVLTGVKAGVKDAQGKYPKNTIHYLVNKKLDEYAQWGREKKNKRSKNEKIKKSKD